MNRTAAPLVALVALVALAACSAAASAPSSQAASSGEPSLTPTDVPGGPTPGSTIGSDPDLPTPPAASLRGAGSDAAVPGTVGSWEVGTFAADAGWPPVTALKGFAIEAVGAAVAFDDGAPIGPWSARLADPLVGDAAPPRTLGGGDAAGATSVALPPLPSGAWVLEVFLAFADGGGDGAFYWAIEVR